MNDLIEWGKHQIHKFFPYVTTQDCTRRYRVQLERATKTADRRIAEFHAECQDFRNALKGTTHGPDV